MWKEKHLSIWCLVISLSLPWVMPLIVSVSKQPGGSQEMTGLIFKPHVCDNIGLCERCKITALTLWPNEFSIQGIVLFSTAKPCLTRVDPVLCQHRPSCFVSSHTKYFYGTLKSNNRRVFSSIVELKHTLSDLGHFLSSSERLHAVRRWRSHILSSSGSHVGEGYTCK